MKRIARQWEEKFDTLQSENMGRHYEVKLESFLQDLYRHAWKFEMQSDGSSLLIFSDGSVYGEESELEPLLCRVGHRTPEAKQCPARKLDTQRTAKLELYRKGHK